MRPRGTDLTQWKGEYAPRVWQHQTSEGISSWYPALIQRDINTYSIYPHLTARIRLVSERYYYSVDSWHGKPTKRHVKITLNDNFIKKKLLFSQKSKREIKKGGGEKKLDVYGVYGHVHGGFADYITHERHAADGRLLSQDCGECELWLWTGRGTRLNCVHLNWGIPGWRRFMVFIVVMLENGPPLPLTPLELAWLPRCLGP